MKASNKGEKPRHPQTLLSLENQQNPQPTSPLPTLRQAQGRFGKGGGIGTPLTLFPSEDEAFLPTFGFHTNEKQKLRVCEALGVRY